MKFKIKKIFARLFRATRSRVRELSKQDTQRGATFVEVLVTIAIIAILMTTVAIAVIPFIGSANVAKAKSDIGALKTAMVGYYLANSDYPDPGSWTEDLKQYMGDGKVPDDPWTKEPYIYTKPGPQPEIPFEIRSSGPNKTSGDEDDIVSWDMDAQKDDEQNP